MMRKIIFGIAAIGVALGVSVGPQAFAQKLEEKNVTINGAIKTIDKKTKTLTVVIASGPAEGKERTIAYSSKTKIQKDGKINLSYNALNEGDKANVTYRQGTDSKTGKNFYNAIQVIVTESAPKQKK